MIMKKTIILCVLKLMIINSINSGIVANNLEENKKLGSNSIHPSSVLIPISKRYQFDLLIKNFNSLDDSVLLKKSNVSASNKSPWLAFFLSYVFPGGGQWYNGEYTKALIMEGIVVVGLGLIFFVASSLNYDSESNPKYLDNYVYAGVAIGWSGWIWSLIDAPISATRINESNAKQKSLEFVSYVAENHTLSLNYNKALSSYILKVNFNF